MNIVVTGSAGFFGSYVTNYLIDQGHKIIGLDNLSRRGSELNAKNQRNNLFMEFHECDVSVKKHLDLCLKGKKIDWIVDCAADPTVMESLLAYIKSAKTTNIFLCHGAFTRLI